MAVLKTALLLSGGMDSVSIAYWKRPQLCITIDYGQKPAAAELRAASEVCSVLDIPHEIIRADLSALGSGDLSGKAALDLAPVSEWWPYRNQMLITLAAMRAVGLGTQVLMIGALRTDNIHLDGTSKFVEAISLLTKLQEGGLTVEAPAIELDAVELVEKSQIPLEILSWAHSCHVSEFACGLCRGCQKHYDTIKKLGRDPY